MGKLYIPINIRKRKEHVEGISKTELVYASVMGGLGLALGIIFYITKWSNILVLASFPIILCIITLALVRKNKMNQSFIDQIKFYVQFVKSQKRFYYTYHNPYEKRSENEEGSSRKEGTDS